MDSRQDLAALLARWRADRMAFRREAILLEDGRAFGAAIDSWQEEDFRTLDDSRYRHGYLERPRGHSKTGDVGTEAVAELVLGAPGRRLFCCAADEDQGRLLFDDCAAKFARSPLLAPLVKVTKAEIIVKATGSRLRVLAADAPTSWGLRPDWIAVDELAEWRKRDLWDSLWTATGKRRLCRMLVITSAGWDRTSIAWEVRQIAEREEDWYFSARGQCASWISPAWLAQQQRTLPPHVYARLHESKWVEGAGAFLTSAEVDAVFTDALPDGAGARVVGVDIGLSKDRSVAAVVRQDSGLVVVESLETWTPRPGAKVDLRDVEDGVATIARDAPIILDPWQGVLMAQRLRARGAVVHEYPFTGESRRKLFGTLLDLIRTARLRSRPHEEFRRELLGLEVQETAAGWRVDHRVGRHDDHVVAVALAAQHVASAPQCDWPGCTTPECNGMHIWTLGDPLPRRREEPPPDLWEAATEPDWAEPEGDATLPVIVGLELRLSSAAAVAIALDDTVRVLVRHATGDHAAVESAVRTWASEFRPVRVCARTVDGDGPSRALLARLGTVFPDVEAGDGERARAALDALLRAGHVVLYRQPALSDPATRRALALACLMSEDAAPTAALT